ncbi:ribosome production factor 2 homolog [Mizuhopecten yessoensis]|uniref:Ribosome production factor 2 homolog n=1 Tax=Mizuhopecten yessoensis TaxID=6573 RepID=A0A210QTB5_MIZYE|nr:ribosome production factor 2 homolog [Mizuhopecten yessoensis]OWF51978.1 Ribosome production factor 2-like [Mizuhopecten yessoensis]
MVLQRIVKPKTQKGKRFLEGREPKVIESTKSAIFVKGGNTSITVTEALKELYILKKPNAVSYKRKNILRPFEDETPLEFFAKKSDAALFAFGCHSKKRPDNLILGRMFDFHVLDMFELGIEKFKSMYAMQGAKCNMGSKPCLLFCGEAFDQDAEHKRLKNLFIDFFRGPVISQVRLAGLEHVIQITSLDGKILLRNYKIMMKKSGSKTPRVELDDMGPSIDFVIRRTKLASDDLYKRSLRQPKTVKPRKRKNISQNAFGSKLGRIHMDKQDLGKLQTRKMKGLKKRKSAKSKDSVTQPKVVKETNGPPKAKRAKKTVE